MERNSRYEVLEGEESNVCAEPVALAMVLPQHPTPPPSPPPYQALSERKPTTGFCPHGESLPSYSVATNLPSYEEAERTKQETNDVERSLDDSRAQDDQDHLTDVTVGTDWIFLCTFIMSFLFNWLGFLMSLCITNTVAGRCGALSGLGLSVVKWVAIVKHSNWASGFAGGDSWVWWILIICGFLLFVRGCVQYVHVKYEWKRLTGHLHRYYLF